MKSIIEQSDNDSHNDQINVAKKSYKHSVGTVRAITMYCANQGPGTSQQ